MNQAWVEFSQWWLAQPKTYWHWNLKSPGKFRNKREEESPHALGQPTEECGAEKGTGQLFPEKFTEGSYGLCWNGLDPF